MPLIDFPMDAVVFLFYFFSTGICKSWNGCSVWNNHWPRGIRRPRYTMYTMLAEVMPRKQSYEKFAISLWPSPSLCPLLCLPGALFHYFKPLKIFRQSQKWSWQRNISSFPPHVYRFLTERFGSKVQVRPRWSLGEGQMNLKVLQLGHLLPLRE